MDVEIKRSGIDELGAFALRPFKAGEVVLRWDVSRRVHRGQADDIPDSEKKYLHPYDEESLIVVQPPERYVNHSCDHNTEVRNFCDVAVRDIRAGEEITSDYEADGAGLKFVCRCGSAKCRGSIGNRAAR
ncbi:MAG TPA: SET domain-containing protein-lysine N-methyltransferase [Pyrinomonadaceae bacterium]|nr:SET domain-containing protein-lysine N-methyltransferase [Pyrinomonadaceae bacterium]